MLPSVTGIAVEGSSQRKQFTFTQNNSGRMHFTCTRPHFYEIFP